MNKVIMKARLSKEVEVRYSQSNMAVARTSIAVDKQTKNQEGKREADFFNILAFDKKAEFLSKYFVKGQEIIIEGKLQNNNWTDKDGNKRTSTEIVVEQTYFSGKAPERENAYPAQENTTSVANGADSGGVYELSETDPELPF